MGVSKTTGTVITAVKGKVNMKRARNSSPIGTTNSKLQSSQSTTPGTEFHEHHHCTNISNNTSLTMSENANFGPYPSPLTDASFVKAEAQWKRMASRDPNWRPSLHNVLVDFMSHNLQLLLAASKSNILHNTDSKESRARPPFKFSTTSTKTNSAASNRNNRKNTSTQDLADSNSASQNITPFPLLFWYRFFTLPLMLKSRYACPSGDAAQAGCLATFFYFFGGGNTFFIYFFLPWVCLGRVFYCCHWIEDTVIGASIGASVCFFFANLLGAYLP